MNKNFQPEERVIWRKYFQGQLFDLRGKTLFTRFDACEFVKCTLPVSYTHLTLPTNREV